MSSFSDDLNLAPPGKIGRAMRAANKQSDSSNKPGPGKIVGHCTVLAGSGSLTDGPCVELLLILNDPSGSEVVRTRTDKNGNFVFEAADGGTYTIASCSKFVSVTSPKTSVASGQSVDLKLQEQ
jgi:hypothetical protein